MEFLLFNQPCYGVCMCVYVCCYQELKKIERKREREVLFLLIVKNNTKKRPQLLSWVCKRKKKKKTRKCNGEERTAAGNTSSVSSFFLIYTQKKTLRTLFREVHYCICFFSEQFVNLFCPLFLRTVIFVMDCKKKKLQWMKF